MSEGNDWDDGLEQPAESVPDVEAAALAEAQDLVGGEVSAVGLGSTDDGDPCVVVYASADSADLPSYQGALHFAAPWGHLALVFVAVLAAALLTTLAPAARASRVHPAEALRYE